MSDQTSEPAMSLNEVAVEEAIDATDTDQSTVDSDDGENVYCFERIYEGNDEDDGKSVGTEDLDTWEQILRLTKAMQFDRANQLIFQWENALFAGVFELVKDSNGRTAAHYAAGHQNGEETLRLIVNAAGRDCMLEPDEDNATPTHYSMALHSKEELLKNRRFLQHSKTLKMRDAEGNTCLHWAGWNRRHGQQILTTIAKERPQCLTWRNNKKQTVLHRAVENLSAEAVKELIEIATPNIIAMRDDEGNTWVHYAVNNDEHNDVVLYALERQGSKCLSWTNKKNVPVLHHAVSNCEPDIVKQIWYNVDITNANEAIKLTDDNKNSIGHYAASNDHFEVLDFVVEKLGAECLRWRNKAKISAWHTAMKHYRHLEQLLRHANDQELVNDVDEDGDTPLHALFQLDEATDEESRSEEALRETAEVFLQAVQTLVAVGVDPKAENNMGRNCLHASTLDYFILNAVLCISATTDEARDIFEQLMLNTKGRHVVHVFATKYDLDDIADALAELSEMPVSELLHLVVSSEPHNGATCLHFACEAGDIYNIKYLVKQGLSLSAETESGLSCVDFAHEKGVFGQVLEALEDEDISVSMTVIWRLLDPAKRALMLPDRLTARQLITSISDETMTAEVHRDKRSERVAEDQQDAKKATAKKKIDISEKDESRTDLKILLKAVELDSPQILRSAFSLNLVTTDTENIFPAFLRRIIVSDKFESYGTLTTHLQLNSFVRASIESDSETAIIDAVAYLEKVEILSDLILTRQFDVIPACIGLLVRLKPKVSQMIGKHEQLKQLYAKVTSVAVNALDELYFGADESEKILLFKYIKGELRDSDEQKQGPKFPCRNSIGGGDVSSSIDNCTVMQMVEHVGDIDLFATDCIHSLVQNEWHPEKSQRVNGGLTPRAKFYIHLTAFLVFLIFFAWYIIDFRRAFQFWPPDFVLFLYALAFTMQEISDVWRGRKLGSVSFGGKVFRCPLYFKDVLNVFDCSAILFMWTGLLWKLAMWACLPGASTESRRFILMCVEANGTSIGSMENATKSNESLVTPISLYACQMILSMSFLLWGFRSVSFLSYSERIGPVITMLKNLLIQDLVPFFAIILVIFYSFGVFFFNLLFPVIATVPAERGAQWYGWNVFLQVFTLPFNLLFTNFDNIGYEEAPEASNLSVGSVAHPDGLGWFSNLLVFVFLILANIVMLNLLIARFSLTVSRMDSKALGIWRKTNFEMMREYQNGSPVPLPLSVFYYPIALCIWCNDSVRCRRGEDTVSEEWWKDEENYPWEYHQFLKFQATQFRRIRPQLSKEVTRNKSDTDALMAHTENLVSAVSKDTQESLQRMDDKLQSMQNAMSKIENTMQLILRNMERN